MNIELIEEMHIDVQSVADKAMGMALLAVDVARKLSKELQAWVDTLPKESTLESEAEKLFSPELQAWLPEYIKINTLSLSERVHESKPRIIQEAMKLLDIIPTILSKD